MNQFHQHLFPLIFRILSTQRLIKCTRQAIIYPFYHTVSNQYLPHIHPLYTPKKTKEFIEDIDFLLKNFQPVDIKDILSHIKQEKTISKPSFHLSFDDGLREVQEVILPILSQKGIPFTVFINSGFVDNKELFYRHKSALIISKIKEKQPSDITGKEIGEILKLKKTDPDSLIRSVLRIRSDRKILLDSIASILAVDFDTFLKNTRPYLTLEELRAMQKQGVFIGAHSIDHPDYSLLPETEQVRQTQESCLFVKEVFSEPTSVFAFPFSDVKIKESFFSEIHQTVDLTFGTSGMQSFHGGKHQERIDMETYGNKAKDCINKACISYLVKKI